ncbi:LAFE_0F09736g1_1 [Lachancea fermentati]|uniref:LAFE_0F09736g1_1 n=1 Tax=Lachancea fermentati TaxID=4955 RepID=A0A1G4MFF2_LACFM|nr:LAFE_0F09736g1_1 [Lachancea fermentati]
MSAPNQSNNTERWVSPNTKHGLSYLAGHPHSSSGSLMPIQPLVGNNSAMRIPPRPDSVPPLGNTTGTQPQPQTQHSFLTQSSQQAHRSYSNHFLPFTSGKQQLSYPQGYPPLTSGYLPSPIPQTTMNEKGLDLHVGFQSPGQPFQAFHPATQHFASPLESDQDARKQKLSDYHDSNDTIQKDAHTIKKNTQESTLKALAIKHKGRPLAEYATMVREAEIAVLNMSSCTHPKTEIQIAEQHRERERQVYALIWLMNTCIPEKDSYVPRGRIFAQYAACCAQHNLKPLSQASLGKLIRTIYPDLTTRRLGMRGQSKYHYCGLKLLSPSKTSSPSTSSVSTPDLLHTVNTENSYGSNSVQSGPSTRSATPALYHNPDSKKPYAWQAVIQDDGLQFIEGTAEKVIPRDSTFALDIPSISPFLKPNTDSDIASALEALYKVHCNTIYENINFSKFDALPVTLDSFSSGSISPQMFNLFISDNLYEWINDADLVTHKAMARMLSKFAFEPKEIANFDCQKFKDFSLTYSKMISEANIDLPVPVVTQKGQLAENFTRLVKRLIKLVQASKNAATALSMAQTRRNMGKNWEKLNIHELCRSEFMCCWKGDSFSAEIPLFISEQMNELFMQDDSTEGLDLVLQFGKAVVTFVEKFKELPARLIVMNINSFTAALLRELYIAGPEDIGSWWALKSFIDEWLYWCAEFGGFLAK